MPSRALLDEFIAVVESGDHAGAIERYYTEDASMQENAAPPRHLTVPYRLRPGGTVRNLSAVSQHARK